MNQSYRNFLRRIIQLEQLTDQKQVTRYGYSKESPVDSEESMIPIHGFYHIHWKETSQTYQLIDYLLTKDVFIFQVCKDTAIASTFMTVLSNLREMKQTKNTEWYQLVQNILSEYGSFLVTAPFNTTWDDPLTLILHLLAS